MAVFHTDFSEYSTESEVLDDWTEQGSPIWALVSDSAWSGGQYISLESLNENCLTYDAADGSSQIEVVVRAQGISGTPGLALWQRLSDLANDGDGYQASIDLAPSLLGEIISRFDDGDNTTLNVATDYDGDRSGFWWARMQMNGDDLKVRIWEDGTGEPSSWTYEVTDPTYDSGTIGIASYNGDEVGVDVIGVGTEGDAAPTDEPETYFEDFSDASTGTGIPDYMNVEYGDSSEWSVDAGGDLGGNYLAVTNNSTVSHDESQSLSGTVEVAYPVRRDGLSSPHGMIHAGGDPDNGGINGYALQVAAGGGFTDIVLWQDGNSTFLATNSDYSFDQNTWYWFRFRFSDGTLYANWWESGTSEPSGWRLEASNSTHSSGFAGFGGTNSTEAQFDAIGIGTNGATAPTEAETATADLTWDDLSGNEEGFRVYRSTVNNPTFDYGNADYDEIEDIGTFDTESYTDTGAPLGEDSVCYAVTSYNSYGESTETMDCVSTAGQLFSQPIMEILKEGSSDPQINFGVTKDQRHTYSVLDRFRSVVYRSLRQRVSVGSNTTTRIKFSLSRSEVMDPIQTVVRRSRLLQALDEAISIAEMVSLRTKYRRVFESLVSVVSLVTVPAMFAKVVDETVANIKVIGIGISKDLSDVIPTNSAIQFSVSTVISEITNMIDSVSEGSRKVVQVINQMIKMGGE